MFTISNESMTKMALIKADAHLRKIFKDIDTESEEYNKLKQVFALGWAVGANYGVLLVSEEIHEISNNLTKSNKENTDEIKIS